MDRDAIATGLADAGLSEHEAEAYLTLLEQGTSEAVDVARRSSIPVPRIYDVVKQLEQRGYVETMERDTLHVRANEPVEVIEDLHERSQRLSTVATAIEDRWEETPMAEHDVNVTKRAETAIDHARKLIREADHSVDLAVSADAFPAFEKALTAVADEDVVVRLSVYLGDDRDSVLDSDVVADAVTELRERSYPTALLAVVDGEAACYAPTNLPDPFGVILKGDHLTLVFRWYFQTCLWAVWAPPTARAAGCPIYVSLEEFVVDVYAGWEAGETIRVRVEGLDTDTGDPASVEGTLVDAWFTSDDELNRAPTLTELSGEVSIAVEAEDRRYTVGSWCAQLEDLEAQRIEVV